MLFYDITSEEIFQITLTFTEISFYFIYIYILYIYIYIFPHTHFALSGIHNLILTTGFSGL